jgi:hypothetical protein
MPATPPILDSRGLKDVLAQLARLAALELPEWKPPAEGDAGTMLQLMYARLIELAIQRLNLTLEKNRAAFLDRMGVALLAPAAARVPLTLTLAQGTGPTFVAAGAQAGTKPSGNQPAVIFETDKDVTIIPARAVKAITMDPVWDRFTDQTAAVGGTSSDFTPLVGTRRMPHVLYLGDDQLLDFATAAIDFRFSVTGDLNSLLDRLSWEYTGSGSVTRLAPTRLVSRTRLSEPAPDPRNQIKLADATGLIVGDDLRIGPVGSEETRTIIGIAGDGSIELAAPVSPANSAVGIPVEVISPPDLRFLAAGPVDESLLLGVAPPQDVASFQALQSGIRSRWLRGVLDRPISDDQALDSVQMIASSLRVSASGLLPDVAFTNTAPAEVTKAFFPFGTVPRVGDAFYISSREAFSKPNATVRLEVAVQPLPGPSLVWESWDGNAWAALPSSNVQDQTSGLVGNGVISLLAPPGGSQLAAATTASVSATFLRTRISTGKYRGAPQISDFELVKTTRLTQAVNPNDALIKVDFPDFAAPGQIIVVDQEPVLVSGLTDNKTLSLKPPFTLPHPSGTTVQLRGGTPVGTLSQAAQGKPQLQVLLLPGLGPGLQANDVLLVYDGANPEFITVNAVTLGDGAGSAATVTCRDPLRFPHTGGLTLARLTDLNLFGFANGDELNLNAPKSFLPFGDNPGQGNALILLLSGFEFLFPLASPSPLIQLLNLNRAAAIFAIAGTPAGAATGQSQVANFTGAFAAGLPRFHFTPQARINFSVAVKIQLPPLELVWEFLGGQGWEAVGSSNVADDTEGFRVDDGGDHLIVLSGISAVLAEVNGIKDYWLRARVASGSYGLPVDYILVDPADPTKGFGVKPGTDNLNPPVLTKLTISYVSERRPRLLTQNGFLFNNVLNTGAGVPFRPFVPVGELVPVEYADPDPAFYIGFDAAFPELPVTLYFARSPEIFAGNIIKGVRSANPAASASSLLAWEYFDGTRWKPLVVFDLTNDFTEVGTIEFLTPVDIAPFSKFDPAPLFWIRATGASNQPGLNQPADTPRLLGVFLNTTTAIQAVTVASETIGSGNAQSNQALATARAPVLPGQQVMVREPEQPPDKELELIELEEGADAVQLRPNPVTGQTEIWVRWHEIDSFLRSDAHSRHYTMDHTAGKVTFGDGVHGLTPPAGTNNIVATYRSGGGAAGNVGQGAVIQVKSPLPGIAGVVNRVPADGGADAETISMALDRGPQTLRHRFHAVAAADIEWLARQADGARVARARCIPNVNRDLDFEPGWVTLIVVPQSGDPRPTPSAELTRLVEDYLKDRAPIGLGGASSQLSVIGPGYVRVAVAAEIVPQNIEQAQQVKQRVRDALAAFLHPLTGGSGGGWDFGRNVYSSEVYHLLQGLTGVDHVTSLQLIPNAGQRTLRLAPLVSEGLSAGSPVSVKDRTKSAILAEPVGFGSAIDAVAIKSFKEGDRITRAMDLVVLADDQGRPKVLGNQVSVAPFGTDSCGFPRGSTIATFDGARRVHLAQAIPRSGSSGPSSVTQILVDDPAFASALKADEVLTVFYPFPMSISTITMRPGSLVVQIEPYFVEASLPPGAVIATHDNRLRLPLSKSIDEGRTIASIELQDFHAGETVTIGASAGPGNALEATIQTVGSIQDTVYLEDNFLVYSGAHQIAIVEPS